MTTRKSSGYIDNLHQLKAGDILIFRASKSPSNIQKFIMFLQSLISFPNGEFDSTHTGICTGVDAEGNPLIAHLTGHTVMGYKLEPLQQIFDRSGGARPFIVFRPQEEQVASEIAKVASNEEENKKIKWNIPAAMGAFMRLSSLNPNRKITQIKQFTKDSFCSKFVIQAIKIATQPEALKTYYPHIVSSRPPKTLEAELYKNLNYSRLVYPGKTSPYQLLQDELLKQLELLAMKKSAFSQKKYHNLLNKFEETKSELDLNEGLNDLEKAILLLKDLLPILARKTQFRFWNADCYTAVMEQARWIGINQTEVQALKSEQNEAQVPIHAIPAK